MRGNPEEFRAVARRLRSELNEAENDQNRIRSAGAYFDMWKSPAADEFSSGYHEVSKRIVEYPMRDLRDLAISLEKAADELADAIRATRSLETRIRAWFASQPVPEEGSPPIWETQWWKYRPGRFPPTGDSEWFDVNRYLRGLGLYF